MPRSSSQAASMTRRVLLRTAGGAAVAAGATLAVAHPSPVAAHDDGAALLGSWIINVMRPTAVPDGTLVTFTPGGGFTRAGDTHPTEGSGHGAWEQVGDAEFEVTYLTVQFDKQGTFIGHRKAWQHLTLDPSGVSFTGRARGALIDPSGTQTPGAPCQLRGDRMVAEPYAQ